MTDRNPLIENQTDETLLNISAVLAFVQEFHESVEITSIDKVVNIGLALTLKCANHALDHEIDNITKGTTGSEKSYVFEA